MDGSSPEAPPSPYSAPALPSIKATNRTSIQGVPTFEELLGMRTKVEIKAR
jgi:hypothetical protein